MDTVHIKKLTTRYRLAQSELGLRDRLDTLLRRVLDEALDMALERVGISPDDEVCIRNIHMLIRLRTSASDWNLIAHWSMAVAEYIRKAIDSGGAGEVVRYRSRYNGMLDFARSVAGGHLGRIWAWRQLGITEMRDDATVAQAHSELIKVLSREPQFIVPVCVSLAKARLLHNLIEKTAASTRRLLVTQALAHLGLDRKNYKTPVEYKPDSASPLDWIFEASPIARAIAAHPHIFNAGGDDPQDWLILIALETEPSIFRRDRNAVIERLQNIASVLAEKTDFVFFHRTAEVESSIESETSEHSSQARADTAEHRAQSDRSNIEKERSREFSSDSTDLSSTASSDSAPSKHQQAPVSQHEAAQSGSFKEGPGRGADTGAIPKEKFLNKDFHVKEMPEHTEVIEAAGFETQLGGLLFLLPLLEREGLVAEIIASPVLAERPLGWVLQYIAQNLIDIRDNDPALQAFCGVEPGEKIPWDCALPVTGPEQTLIETICERIVVTLRDVTGWENNDTEWLLDKVCRRHARIEADPGWLEITFYLSEVVTEIRRAALDLDPGYIPWLGMAVKFRYE